MSPPIACRRFCKCNNFRLMKFLSKFYCCAVNFVAIPPFLQTIAAHTGARCGFFSQCLKRVGNPDLSAEWRVTVL